MTTEIVKTKQKNSLRNPPSLPSFSRISGRILFEKTLVEEWIKSHIKKRARPRTSLTPSAQNGGVICR